MVEGIRDFVIVAPPSDWPMIDIMGDESYDELLLEPGAPEGQLT